MIHYFGVKAEIIGEFVLTSPIKTQYNGFQVSIFIEEEKHKISVVKTIPPQSPLELTNVYQKTPPEEAEYQDYILMLKHIAALGGFHYGITKVLYKETLELVWYKGEDAFQDLQVVYSLRKQFPLPKKRILSETDLKNLFIIKKIVPDVLIPYNYYREASTYLNDEEFRQAYLHYFMLLEFCFSSGNTKKDIQVRDFENSPGLKLALLETLHMMKDRCSDHYKRIKEDIIAREKGCFSIKTILRVLVGYRGVLAHGLNRSAPYVFDDKSLRSITLFISQICFSVCGNMQVYCLSSAEYKNTRMTERIEKLKTILNIQ